MNSFYHYVNSDGRKDIHENNHGGDFTVELYDTMDLHGNWEVALVEMSYFGQRFANVPEEYGEIQLTSSARELYNTQFIIHFHELDDLFIDVCFHTMREPHINHKYGRLSFSNVRKHCTFLDFVKIVNAATFYRSVDSKVSADVSLGLDSTHLTMTVANAALPISLVPSYNLKNLLKTPWKEMAFQPKPWGTSKIPISQPPIIVDNSEVLFTPLMKDKWIKINGKLLNIEDFYWTYYSLKKSTSHGYPRTFSRP